MAKISTRSGWDAYTKLLSGDPALTMAEAIAEFADTQDLT